MLLEILLISSGIANAHHGWSSYDEGKTTKLEGTVEQLKYENPHGTIQLKSGDGSYFVVLAPVSRMESRGLTKDMIQVGSKVTVEAYPKESDPKELRAERITAAGKTVELR